MKQNSKCKSLILFSNRKSRASPNYSTCYRSSCIKLNCHKLCYFAIQSFVFLLRQTREMPGLCYGNLGTRTSHSFWKLAYIIQHYQKMLKDLPSRLWFDANHNFDRRRYHNWSWSPSFFTNWSVTERLHYVSNILLFKFCFERVIFKLLQSCREQL